MEISVVVPAYNSENFIAETLDCLLNQTLKDIQ
ncbi:MAG: glycosyltransferase, partial [Oscillospiraceae bacterium]|nr:glycosyltransferase [Oscillospiraceae bacterium]